MANAQLIIPGRSIGNICLDDSEMTLLSKIEGEYIKEKRSESSCVYHFHSTKVWIDRESKRVYQITVGKGFNGYFQDSISIGSKFYELKKFGHVYCENEIIPVYMIDGIDGICFELDDDETIDDKYDIDEKRIAWISVFK